VVLGHIQCPINLRVVCIVISYCYFLGAVDQQILTRWHFKPVFSIVVSSLSAKMTTIRILRSTLIGSCSSHHFKLLFLVLLNVLFINEKFNYILGILLFAKRELTHFLYSFERRLQLLFCFMENLLTCFSPLLDVLDCSSGYNENENGQNCQEND
jgi:hypothetical protein